MSIEETIAREEIAQRNRDAMSRIAEETGMTFRIAEYAKWRPTVRATGALQGVPVAVKIIATDGVVALYETTTDVGHALGRFFIGHKAWFDGEVKPLYSLAAPKAVKPKKLTREEKLAML